MMKRAIEDIDLAVMKICGVQELARRATVNCQPFVDCTVRRGIRVRYHDYDRITFKSRDRAVLGVKDKSRRARRAYTIVHDKTVATVKNETRGNCLLAACSGN